LRYKFESKHNSTLDLSSYGEPNQTSKGSAFAVFSVVQHDTSGGKIVDVTIDSLFRDDGGATVQASASLGAELTASGRGATFHLYLRSGVISTMVSSMPDNLDVNAVSEALSILFPGVSPTAKVGTAHSDTTETGGGGSATTTRELSRWVKTAKDTLNAQVSFATSRNLGAELGIMSTKGSGTRQTIVDGKGVVVSGKSVMTSTGGMGDAHIQGTTTATLTRIP
jgi:hypothetical protein